MKLNGKLFVTTALLSAMLAGCKSKISVRNRLNESQFPPIVLWAWERPEDLRGLDSKRFAVAFLAQTLVLKGDDVILNPRQQPLQVSPRAHAPMQPKGQLLKASGNPRGQALNAPAGKLGPAVGLSFDGISIDPGSPSTENCANIIGGQLAPPDTNLAVGDTQVVQWVNICYAVYEKSTGSLIAGPFAGNQFWAGFGGVCQINNDGDIIIQWDKANHVWVASQNVFGPFTRSNRPRARMPSVPPTA